MTRNVVVATLAAGLALGACSEAPAEDNDSQWQQTAQHKPVVPLPAVLPEPRVQVIETTQLSIDRLYPSMTGPGDRVDVDISGMDWVTSIHTEVIDVENNEAMSGEFFCHSMLDVPSGQRLTVNATGGERTRFPPGFGLPVSQMMPVDPDQRGLSFFGMVLNNNHPDMDTDVRIRATIEYYSDEDVGKPNWMRPLYYVNATVFVQDVEEIEEYVPPIGFDIPDDVSTHCTLVNDKKMHWIVPPGPQRTQRVYRKGLVPVDGTVHFAQAHMHNYGRWVRLIDTTTDEVLWQADASYAPDRMQIESISGYSSSEGFPVYKDHKYVVEAHYDNTTDHDVDAMAVIYLYVSPKGGQTLVLQ